MAAQQYFRFERMSRSYFLRLLLLLSSFLSSDFAGADGLDSSCRGEGGGGV